MAERLGFHVREMMHFYIMPQGMTAIKENKNATKVYAYGLICDEVIGRMADELHYYGRMASDCINLHLNSIGGGINVGVAGIACIQGCALPVDIYVDGIAASMGAFMGLSGRKMYMSKYARLMLHAGRIGEGGTAGDLRENAALLEGYDRDLCRMVCAKTGMSEAEAKERFFDGKDHWLDTEQAIALKLCDGMYESEVVAEAKSDVEVYALVDNAFKNGVLNFDNHMEVTLTPEARASLGLGANATAAEINAAMATLAQRNNAMTLELAAHKNTIALAAKNEVTALLGKALDDKKVTAEYQAVLATQYEGKPVELKALLDVMPSFVSVNERLSPSERGTTAYRPEVVALMAQGWDKLDKTDQLKNLKAADNDAYVALYKTKFGYEPNKSPVPVAVVNEFRKRTSFPTGKAINVE